VVETGVRAPDRIEPWLHEFPGREKDRLESKKLWFFSGLHPMRRGRQSYRPYFHGRDRAQPISCDSSSVLGPEVS
jgi:hypothetical protein